MIYGAICDVSTNDNNLNAYSIHTFTAFRVLAMFHVWILFFVKFNFFSLCAEVSHGQWIT